MNICKDKDTIIISNQKVFAQCLSWLALKDWLDITGLFDIVVNGNNEELDCGKNLNLVTQGQKHSESCLNRFSSDRFWLGYAQI